MSKLMNRLEILEKFVEAGQQIKREALLLQAREQKMNDEIGKWVETELGITGNVTMPELLKKVLETSFDPPGKIIAP